MLLGMHYKITIKCDFQQCGLFLLICLKNNILLHALGMLPHLLGLHKIALRFYSVCFRCSQVKHSRVSEVHTNYILLKRP